MAGADMIRYLILNHFQSPRVGLPYQLLEDLEVAEAIFNCVIVYGVIAVIVGIWTPGLVAGVYSVPIVVPGCQPECSHAEVFEVRKVIDNAAQITAVKCPWIPAIVRFWGRISRRVVCRIPIGETVRHQQINYIIVSDTLKIVFGVKWRINGEMNRCSSLDSHHQQRI